MRKLVLPFGLAAILLSPSFSVLRAQAPSPTVPTPAGLPALTLAQAQALAASRSHGLSAAQREVEASDGALQQAGLWRNPELSASVEDSRSATRTTTATLDIPVELGGKRAARIGAAAAQRELAQAELGSAQAQLRADVARAFFGVLIAQERAALATSSEELAARAADTTARRVAAGKVSPVDETRARVDAANAQLETAEAVAELEVARQALAALWGEGELAQAALQGDVEALPTRAPLHELAARLETSPLLSASRSEIERRKALVEVERSKGFQDLTVSLGAKRDNELGRTQAIVGIAIPLALFDRNQGASVESVKRAEKAQEEHLAARMRALTALQQAASQLELARASALSLRTAVLPAARQAHEAATRGFEAGKFGFLDVIDAQRSLLQARARYLSALSSAHQAAAAIDQLVGF